MAKHTTEDQSQPQHLFNLLKGFDVTMMLNGVGEHQHARPMTILEVDERGVIWFISSMEAGGTRELAAVPRVTLICQSKTVYLSVVGMARIVKDPARVDALWKEAFKVWFPEGRSAPDLALLAVTPQSGEFWDQAGTKGLKYLLDAARAYVKGEALQPDPRAHGETRVDEAPAPDNRKSAS